MPPRRSSSSRSRSRSTRRASSSGKVMRITSPQQARALESLIRRGPMTIVLVFTRTCQHCHSYMPMWKEMCGMRRRRSNMVSMEADVYDQMPMSQQKPIEGVPTVLFVDKSGRVVEAEQPRNRNVMKNAVSMGVSEQQAAANVSASETDTRNEMASASNMTATATPISEAASTIDLPEPLAMNSADLLRAEPRATTVSEPTALVGAPVAGTQTYASPLPAMPGTPVSSEMPEQPRPIQGGGNPWAAFMMAATQAAPAAVLLGAYSGLPARSSGLPRATRRSRRVRFQQKN